MLFFFSKSPSLILTMSKYFFYFFFFQFVCVVFIFQYLFQLILILHPFISSFSLSIIHPSLSILHSCNTQGRGVVTPNLLFQRMTFFQFFDSYVHLISNVFIHEKCLLLRSYKIRVGKQDSLIINTRIIKLLNWHNIK